MHIYSSYSPFSRVSKIFLLLRVRCNLILYGKISYLQRNALGQDLMDKVFCQLDLMERDYFGLRYLDIQSNSQWLDPFKEIKKQSKDKGEKFSF